MKNKHTPRTSFANAYSEEGNAIGYMDMTDFECELGAAVDGNKVYPSIKALKEHNKCYNECGIVEVEVKFRKVIQPASRKINE